MAVSQSVNAAIAQITKLLGYAPSQQQRAILAFVIDGRGHAVVDSKAGTGKTSSLTMIALAIALALPKGEDKAVTLIAFSKLIAADLNAALDIVRKLTGLALRKFKATTFHSLGLNTLSFRIGKFAFSKKSAEAKMIDLFAANFTEQQAELYQSFAIKLVHFAKCMGIGIAGMTPDSVDSWQEIIDHHGLMLDSRDAEESEAINIARQLLQLSNTAAKANNSFDFDDLIYIPLLWNLQFFGSHFVLPDECQDINPTRLEMCARLLGEYKGIKYGRLVAVGDPNQAIFGFTGAMHDSVEQITKRFNAKVLNLSVCYRCSAAVIRHAQEIVPDIQAAPGAIEGEAAVELVVSDIVKTLTARDAILCRNTAPLISLAYDIIRRGMGVKLLGRELGAHLAKLVKTQKAASLVELDSKLSAYADREIEKAIAKGDESKIESINDRVDCVRAIAEQLPADGTVADLVAKIESMFADDNDDSPLLTLATIHRVKGKEYDNVALYRPELLPSKFAILPHQYQQEKNLDYVWRTRPRVKSYYLAA